MGLRGSTTTRELDPTSLILINFDIPALTPGLHWAETALDFSDNKTLLSIFLVQWYVVGKEGYVNTRCLGASFTYISLSQSQSHIATDSQSISKSWCRATSGSHDQIFITLCKLWYFFWGPLSDERIGLSFIYAAGPHKCSLSRVRVPWDSWPYFTVSDLRLLFSSPPTTRRVTVEVFESTYTRVT
jgi:hypothetical protein